MTRMTQKLQTDRSGYSSRTVGSLPALADPVATKVKKFSDRQSQKNIYQILNGAQFISAKTGHSIFHNPAFRRIIQ
jgi:hypothetical protein